MVRFTYTVRLALSVRFSTCLFYTRYINRVYGRPSGRLVLWWDRKYTSGCLVPVAGLPTSLSRPFSLPGIAAGRSGLASPFLSSSPVAS